MPPIPGLRGQGTHLGAQQASWARVGGANTFVSSPAPPVLEDPSRVPLLFSPGLLPMPPGPMRPAGGFGGQGTSLGTQQSPRPEWAGQMPSAPLPFLWDGPPYLPLLINPVSGTPILSGLHFSSPLSSPHILLVHLGPPPISLGVSVSHQRPAVSIVVGRY